MSTAPEPLRRRLAEHGQDHVLAFWDSLDDAERRAFAAQLDALDLAELRRLWEKRGERFAVPTADRVGPVDVLPPDGPDAADARRAGEAALRNGEVAALVVAGGQGSRLGSDRPKGLHPVGPVSGHSLFRLHAERVLALRRRHGAPLPLLVMTSPATHADTEAYFREEKFFGLAPDEVVFFCQGTMPALDLATGRLLLEAPGRLCLSPDGHGGTLTALRTSGLLDRLRPRVRHLFYFQVDNPLVLIADPLFLGRHILHRSEMSSKVVPKLGPDDKMGNFATIDRRCGIIEYSDLPADLARRTGPDGRLLLWGGNTAIHIFDVGFLDRVTRDATALPFHLARKKVPHIDAAGRAVQPEKENALKFERFIFDVLPLADRWLIAETTRRDEFAPLKNAEGADSPEAVRQAISDRAADWLSAAGVAVPRRADRSAAVPLEVGPLFALDAGELAGKVGLGTSIDGPRYFG
jgi:UDP-N-acetylglucosamine/UDP-N-acetylgalactosamine diphosphorylase